MSDFLLALMIVGITILGFCKIYWSINRLKIRNDFIQSYLNIFNGFCVENTQGAFDNEKYVWLTKNVGKVQSELGFDGIVYNYQPPYTNYAYSKYQLIINTLPQIRTGQAYNQDIASCEDALLRHLGSLREMEDSYINCLKNPFVWLREGINLIITFPIRMAYWFGVFRYSYLVKMTNNILIKILSFTIGIIGLVSSVITIVMGWTDFVSLIKGSILLPIHNLDK
jgi:hypothetical protein